MSNRHVAWDPLTSRGSYTRAAALRFRVEDLGLGDWRLELGVWGVGCVVLEFGVRFWGLGLGIRVQGLRVQGSGFSISCLRLG